MTNSYTAKPISSTIYVSTIIFNLVHYASSSWIRNDSVLPRADGDFAIGYNPYNETIYLLGGYNSRRQFVEYDIDAQSIVDHGTNSIPMDVFSFAQYYWQVNDIIYIKSSDNPAISTFNVKTKTFIQSHMNMTVSSPGYTVKSLISTCVVATEEYVFIAGGRYTESGSKWVTTNDVHVYDLTGDQWIQNTRSMTHSRDEHSCIIHPDTNALYVFGGFYGKDAKNNQYLSNIEKINIDNITQTPWTSVGDLTQALSTTAAVYYQHLIFIIGGWRVSDSAINIVHIIDVTTDTIAVFLDPLPVVLCEVSAIVVGDMLYVFGGSGDVDYDDGLITYDLQTLNLQTLPTTNPSAAPFFTSATPNPTARPTPNRTSGTPTHNPSSIPTQVLSTAIPSSFPSKHPLYATATNSISSTLTTTEWDVMMSTYIRQTSADADAPEKRGDGLVFVLLIIIGITVCLIVIVLVHVFCYFCRKTKMDKSIDIIESNQSDIVQTPTQCNELDAVDVNGEGTTLAIGYPGENQNGEGKNIVEVAIEGEENNNTKTQVTIGNNMEENIASDEFIVCGDDADDMITKF
eukprot:567972_1